MDMFLISLFLIAGVFLFGKDAKFYVADADIDDSANTPALATWDEYKNVTDIVGNFSGISVETTTRETAETGWTSAETILSTGELTMTFPQKSTLDATLRQFIDAWLAKTTVPCVALNDDITNTGFAEGLAANFSVELTQNQPLQDRQTWDATLRVASFPSWYRPA